MCIGRYWLVILTATTLSLSRFFDLRFVDVGELLNSQLPLHPNEFEDVVSYWQITAIFYCKVKEPRVLSIMHENQLP